MDWIAILEALLPLLLELLKNSPEDQAFAHLRNPDRWVRWRIKNVVKAHLDDLADAAVIQLKAMSDDEIKSLITMAKAA